MANKDYKVTNTRASDFTPLAELADQIDYLQHELPLGRTNFARIDILQVGMACLCDDEFMQIIAITSTGVTVKRGVADTVPARHAGLSLIWFFDNTLMGADGVEHSAGETNSVKYSPYTIGGGSMPISNSEIDTVTYNWRFFRPYPPGQMRVRGQRWYIPQHLAADNPNMLFTWAHRDRILEADRLFDHDVTNIGPEPGTTYIARIYDHNGNLKRTVTDIMAVVRNKYGQLIPPSWNYTWQQAMTDLGFENPAAESEIVQGFITFHSIRQGFDSWQGYRIDFDIDTQGKYIKVAQLAEMAAQPVQPDANTPPLEGVFVGQQALMAAQRPGPETPDTDAVGGEGMYVAQLAEPVGQETNFYTPMNRNLFEAPYAFLYKRGDSPDSVKLVTVVARPSDRLTDAHDIWTRYDWPAGSGAILSYDHVADPLWTPWATLLEPVTYLDDTFTYDKTSFLDGVPLTALQVGMVAQLDAEFIRIDAITPTSITVARGCYDTVPAKHAIGTRIWFVEIEHGNDPTNYPEKVIAGVLGGAVQVKMRPKVYGPQLDLLDVPTDRLQTKTRTQRPYPPGLVMANDKHWYEGGIPAVDQPITISWVHRNRTAQQDHVIDHMMGDQGREDEQKYRLTISVTVRPEEGPSYVVIIRRVIVDGTEFVYTYDMAKQDGYRAGALMGVCGRVTVGLVLESIRYDLVSWQNYVIPLGLPSYKCPPGQPPGGGQLPPNTGNGNGNTGGGTPGGQTPGGDNTGDGPKDPVDNGGTPGGGGNGDGPPDPPDLPPDWPDPVDPPPVDPDDPNPNLGAHWDLNWDRHWDAYTGDDIGG